MRFEFVISESYYNGQFYKKLEENSMVKKRGATTVKYPYPCYNSNVIKELHCLMWAELFLLGEAHMVRWKTFVVSISVAYVDI